jgi:adenosylmethionine-8-amino-7-oxononanoate aminotransferase
MSSVFYRDLGATYPVASYAKGMYLFDTEGRQYLDMSGGAAVSSLGHGHKDIIAAIQAQIGSLAFAHTAFFTNKPQEELAERVNARFVEAGSKVYFSSGGSEANETALKIAWQYWRAVDCPAKTIIISRQFSYHGSTLGALSVSGSAFRRAPFQQVIHDWPRVAPCYAYRHQQNGETPEEYGKRAASDLERAIKAAGPENVAAFIAEPVVGATLGAVPAVKGYFREIRRICDRHEILLVSDEVMCGSGRTGSFFAHEAEGFVPDIVTMAKGLGAGYQPLGATLVRQHLWQAIGTSAGGFPHGHTYIGHATACAAGVAVQQCLDRDDVLPRVRAAESEFFRTLQSSVGSHPNVGDIRGRGLFAGIEFVVDRDTREPFPVSAKIPARIKAAAMDAGLICYPGGGSVDGSRGAHMLLAPPFIAERQHFDELADKLETILSTVFGHDV